MATRPGGTLVEPWDWTEPDFCGGLRGWWYVVLESEENAVSGLVEESYWL